MDEEELVPQDRKAFLAKLGKTLAVGLGFGLVVGTNASARTDTCAIFCSPVCGTYSCANGTCPGVPACANNCFHCTTLCGYDYYDCLPNSCGGGFCYSQNAC